VSESERECVLGGQRASECERESVCEGTTDVSTPPRATPPSSTSVTITLVQGVWVGMGCQAGIGSMGWDQSTPYQPGIGSVGWDQSTPPSSTSVTINLVKGVRVGGVWFGIGGEASGFVLRGLGLVVRVEGVLGLGLVVGVEGLLEGFRAPSSTSVTITLE